MTIAIKNSWRAHPAALINTDDETARGGSAEPMAGGVPLGPPRGPSTPRPAGRAPCPGRRGLPGAGKQRGERGRGQTPAAAAIRHSLMLSLCGRYNCEKAKKLSGCPSGLAPGTHTAWAATFTLEHILKGNY